MTLVWGLVVYTPIPCAVAQVKKFVRAQHWFQDLTQIGVSQKGGALKDSAHRPLFHFKKIGFVLPNGPPCGFNRYNLKILLYIKQLKIVTITKISRYPASY
jgi:hypothetical protein